MSGFDFVVLFLATWRLAHMLVKEDGPWAVFARLRKRAGLEQIVVRNGEQVDIVWHARTTLAEGLRCVWCVSVWCAAILWLGYSVELTQVGTLWLSRLLALSACAIGVNEFIGFWRGDTE